MNLEREYLKLAVIAKELASKCKALADDTRDPQGKRSFLARAASHNDQAAAWREAATKLSTKKAK